jgi:hypothetical protein
LYFHNDADARCSLYDKNGKHFREIKIPISDGMIFSVAYNVKTANIYILADDWEGQNNKILVFDSNYKLKENHKIQNSFNSLKLFNDLIFLTNENSAAFNLHEKNLELISYVTMPKEIKELIIDQNQESFIFIQMESLIGIYNTKNFSTLSFIKNPLTLQTINYETMIFSDYRGYLYFYKMNFKKTKEMLDRRYICKMNNFHYYKNPHFLPCGNTSCYICICSNFNLRKNTLKCRFCSKEHKLPLELEADTKRANLMIKYNDELIQEMMEYGNKILKEKGINLY